MKRKAEIQEMLKDCERRYKWAKEENQELLVCIYNARLQALRWVLDQEKLEEEGI